MQKLLSTALLFLVFLTACKRDTKNANDSGVGSTTASPELLGGYWIAMDFCSRANQYGSVLDAMNNAHVPYAYAITFNPGQPDSVTCFNGSENWNVAIKYNADTLELVGARQGKSIFLVYDSQGSKEMTMFDATTGQVYLEKYIKSKATNSRDGYAAFLLALNHNLMGGYFKQIGKGAAAGDVRFLPDGHIEGLKDYDRYEICTGGDCFVAGQDADVITLYNSKVENSNKFFGFRFSAQNDTLTILNLLNTNPEEKGVYKVTGAAYTFLRKKS
ncbi:MAG: hypothetical protein OHK0019_23040 [Saprospiraceae bacterium]